MTQTLPPRLAGTQKELNIQNSSLNLLHLPPFLLPPLPRLSGKFFPSLLQPIVIVIVIIILLIAILVTSDLFKLVPVT